MKILNRVICITRVLVVLILADDGGEEGGDHVTMVVTMVRPTVVTGGDHVGVCADSGGVYVTIR
jgi:hypothetical protein